MEQDRIVFISTAHKRAALCMMYNCALLTLAAAVRRPLGSLHYIFNCISPGHLPPSTIGASALFLLPLVLLLKSLVGLSQVEVSLFLILIILDSGRNGCRIVL